MSPGGVTTDQWLEAAKYRRTVYGIKGTSAVSDSRIEEIIKKVLDFAPSSFNTQPMRITYLTGEKHKQFWDIIINLVGPMLKSMNEAAYDTMSGVMNGHKAAYGSIVFWVSEKAVKEAGEQHPSAASAFPQFSEHSNGMAQILLWTALELEGLGANLQHMGAFPNVGEALKKFCGVPEDYSLKAHLNYGDEAQEHPAAPPQKLPVSEVLNILN